MPPLHLFLLSMSMALAIVFVAFCVGIYYTHKRIRILKELYDEINYLLNQKEVVKNEGTIIEGSREETD